MEPIKQLIDTELAKVADHSRRERLRSFLVAPELLSLRWGYGQPGDRFDCWLVALSPDRKDRLLYCEQGFGPTYPWGFVGIEEEWMGMDCQWHAGLEDAAIGAGLLDAPPGYEVP
jgi:hypothetical protein